MTVTVKLDGNALATAVVEGLTELREKYSADDKKAALAAGHAMPNANGDPSYVIKDEEDLDNAIHAVGRGNADHDAIRRHIMKRAKALGLSSKIPDNWSADGSLTDGNSARFAARETRAQLRYRTRDFEMRDDSSGTLRFTGYASVTEFPYERSDFYGDYTETIARGAFQRSLEQGAGVDFLVNHNDLGVPMASTRSGSMRLAEDSRGLHVEADLDPARPDVQIVRSAVQRGDLNEMSFAFRVADGGQIWSPDYTQRRITDVNLHRGDVSLVNSGSNPATAGTVDIRSFAGALQELRAGAPLGPASQATLMHVLSLVCAADNAVDEAQPLLAAILGVPNPDADGDDTGMGDDDFLANLNSADFLFDF